MAKTRLPETFITQFAKRDLSVMVGDSLYKARPMAQGESSDDCLKIGSFCYALSRTESLMNLEKLYKRRYNQEISDWEKGFMDSTEFKSMTNIDLDREEQELRLQSFIVGKVFPLFLTNRESVIGIPGVDAKGGFADETDKKKAKAKEVRISEHKDEGMDALLDLLGVEPDAEPHGDDGKKDRPEGNGLALPSDKSLYLIKALEGTDVFFMNGVAFGLKLGDDKGLGAVIVAGKRYAITKPFSTAEKLEAAAEISSLEEILKQEAFKNQPRLAAIAKMKEEINTRLADDDYTKAGIRLEKCSFDTYRFIQAFPRFILYHRGEYFSFPAGEIGIDISIANGAIQPPQAPRILGKYQHPFLPRENTSNKVLCRDNRQYNYPQMEKNVAAYMDDANTVMMASYNIEVHDRFRPYWTLDQGYRMTEPIPRSKAKELVKSGVKITNYNGPRLSDILEELGIEPERRR